MMRHPQVSQAALAAGVPARYLYWFGRSGRRYLFSCTGKAAAKDFESGVAIAVSNGEIVWTGDVQDFARLPANAAPRRTAVFVHFLAATLAERRAVIEDLRPEERAVLRLAA